MFDANKIGEGFKALYQRTTGKLRPKSNVTDYRDFVLRRGGDLLVVPEPPKCNRKAAKLRQQGNRLYLDKQYDDAVSKYNESICYAEAGSEHLGMGYANRSAVYFEEGEYEYALVNIGLARENHNPEKFMPKLVEREEKCRERLAAGLSKGTELCYGLDLNVAPNPKIPFIADGIAMRRYPQFGGRGLVAERDFKPGDIILDEKPMLMHLSSWRHYCSCCAAFFRGSLIPCPGCVNAMYCSEECRQQDYRYWHRFQCGFVEQLDHVQYVTTITGPKRFFYLLSAFGDDLDAMMTFCESEATDDPFTVDHTKEDRILEAMKVLHQAKVKQPLPEIEAIMRLAAAAFYAVFIKHPLLQQLANTGPKKDFIVRTFLDYIRKNTALSLDCLEFVHFTNVNAVSSISSLANHSHDPNALFQQRYGKLRFFVIRPIRAGDQITVSYGPTWWEPMPTYSSVYTCRCPVCDEADTAWCVREGTLPKEALRMLNERPPRGKNNAETEANVLRHLFAFFDRYGSYHPEGAMGPKLQVIKHLMCGQIHEGAWTMERAQVAAKVLGGGI
uniref:SET and MYND domain-containing protein 4 n=1 Tax=Culex pipiens TaxID=7175 RepID=A0A8D8JN18_CULPI